MIVQDKTIELSRAAVVVDKNLEAENSGSESYPLVNLTKTVSAPIKCEDLM